MKRSRLQNNFLRDKTKTSRKEYKLLKKAKKTILQLCFR